MSNSRSTIMAYTPMPKLVPIGSPRITPVDAAKNMISEVLKSEPVKRLLSQPNIVLKAISLTSPNRSSIRPSTSETSIIGNVFRIKDKRNDSVTLSNSHLDDKANFLPSKTDGKSEVALLPIKHAQKKCGHYEPCENIICDVNFQQYVDYEGSSPILAFNIDESEINAPVSKHCGNSKCDALSIDHNRCRRVAIRTCRCDKSYMCDICGASLKTRKSRFNHKNCKRRNVYQHNNIDTAQILRERMRMKELQMMAALRMKKNNYGDPSTADDKAIEILKNNAELIVIPKTTTKVTSLQPPPLYPVNPISNQSLNDDFGNNLLSNEDISIFSQSATTANSQLGDQQNQKNSKQKLNNSPNKHQKAKQKISKQQLNNNSSSKITAGESTNDNKTNRQYIVTGVPQGTVAYSLPSNDFIMAHTTGTSMLPSQKPYIMPVRVVPIAKLKSKPSLLHQTQGIPKFCIIADNSAPPRPLTNFPSLKTIPFEKVPKLSKSIVPSSSPTSKSVPKSTISTPAAAKARSVKTSTPKSPNTNSKAKSEKKPVESPITSKLKTTSPRGQYESRNKKRVEKKLFICTYCSKRFLTEWYFKMHIARHIGEVKAVCQLCDKTFTHHYDLKRHVNTEHNDIRSSSKNNNMEIEEQKIVEEEEDEVQYEDVPITCGDCENVFSSNVEMTKHKCKKIINNDTNNGGVIIINSDDNECNEEIEKENGIVRRKIGDTLQSSKLREIAKSQSKIIRKNIRKHKIKNKKCFNIGNDEASNVSGILKC